MKKILLSLGIVIAVAGVVAGGTIAFYNDTETSTGNIFTAGSVDLTVDHTYASYNGEVCVDDCDEDGSNLIINGGFEDPDIGTGTWHVYPYPGIPGWIVESGAGIEIQDHAAGNPHTGGQLVELDSNNPSSMSQSFATVAGEHYRLHFWYSPRPNRPSNDNAIDYAVKVVSGDSVIISGTVGVGVAGETQTTWTEKIYDFTAVDALTKVYFSDASIPNSYGGYLDDVSVFHLTCSGEYANGGMCHTWNEQNLNEDDGNFFWHFDDIKPGDQGVNVISLHIDDNDSFVCLLPSGSDEENTVVEPEVGAGDNISSPIGELSQELEFFGWLDDGDGIYQTGDTVVLPAGTPMNMIQTEIVAMSLTSAQPINVGLAWCAGDQTGPIATNDSTPINCDGNGMGDIAQTDMIIADLIAYAEQQRNNTGFLCENVQVPEPMNPPHSSQPQP